MADVFRALDDETRRLILDELVRRPDDGLTLFDVCSLLLARHGVSVTRAAGAAHLGILQDAGLVRTGLRGRSTVFLFDPEPLAEIARRWPVAVRSEP